MACTSRGRFTPMHMGTTHAQRSPWRPPSVHPHAHGDNCRLGVAGRQSSIGSPPCAWGQRGSRASALRLGSVHPHAHGDNAGRAASWPLTCGSPPCAWGQRSARDPGAAIRRFTPMRMGTTLQHPHAAAGRSRFTPMCMGTTEAIDRAASRSRFTPMCMGTTSTFCILRGMDTRCSPSKSTIFREVSPWVRTTKPCSPGELHA